MLKVTGYKVAYGRRSFALERLTSLSLQRCHTDVVIKISKDLPAPQQFSLKILKLWIENTDVA